MQRDPVNADGGALDVSDYFPRDQRGRPSGAAVDLGAVLVKLGSAEKQLEYLYRNFTPIHQQWGVRWDFKAGLARNDPQNKVLPVEHFPFLVAAYRWAWSGQVDGQLVVPITMSYGTSQDRTLNRPTSIVATWGSVLRWATPPRIKVLRPGTKILFRAQLDYTLLPLRPDDDDIRATTLDVTVDGVQLYPV